MKRILLSIATIALVGAGVAGFTGAFFSDTETSAGNVFAAGSIDLRVDSVSHWNDMVCVDTGDQEPNYEWTPIEFVTYDENFHPVASQYDVQQWNNDNPAHYPQAGTDCAGTWELTDLGPSNSAFFNFGDLKPGDNGENTISLHLENNEGWACAVISNMENNDNGLTEPEAEDGDNTGGDGEGELADELHFFAWSDDGDNIWEDEEIELFSNISGPASDVIDGVSYPLYTPDVNGGIPMTPGETEYIGMYWCYGEITVDAQNNELSCDGSASSNITQSDSLTADISFYVEQSRNNPDFECPLPEAFEEEEVLVGADLLSYEIPSSCDVVVDDSFDTETPGSEYQTIQAAIDDENNVSDGSVVCVAEGTYNEFDVDRPLTIAGLVNPTNSATVVPSGSGVTELAFVNSSNVTITGLHFDGNGTEFTGNQTAGIQISPAGGNIDNVTVAYNLIENLPATDDGAASKGIQWFTEGDTGHTLTNSNISNNVIQNVSSVTNGGYGFQGVGAMSNVSLTYNTISDITGNWGAGIAFDTKDSSLTTMSGVLVSQNQIMDNVHNGTDVFAGQVEFSVDATGIAFNTNNIQSLVHGGGNTDLGTEGTLDAENNWWGDADPSDDTFGDVDYTPFQTSAYSQN